MKNKKSWHEKASLWRTAAPVLFSRGRQADAPGEIEQIISLARLKKKDHILDLCCGEGRHSLELARRGFRVTGVDNFPAYLAKARRQAAREKIEVSLVQDDMRTFCMPSAFHAAINMFTSFGFFVEQEDDRRVVTSVYRSLRPGGVFLMDLMGKEIAALNFREKDWYEEGGMYVLEWREPAEDWSRMNNRWIIFRNNRRSEITISLRLYSARELTTMLKDCGFENIAVYGDLEGNPYNLYARRLVVLARKGEDGVRVSGFGVRGRRRH